MPDADPQAVDMILSQAREKMARYDWMLAAELLKRVSDQPRATLAPSETARTMELSARCYFMGAFQSESRDKFKDRMKLAIAADDNAASLYEALGLKEMSKRLEAKRQFARFWLTEKAEERRRIIQECISLSDEAVLIFDQKRDRQGLAGTLKEILVYSTEALRLATDWKAAKEQFERAVDVGRRAIKELENLGRDEELVETLHLTLWLMAVKAESILEPPRFRELTAETIRLGNKLTEASDRVGTPYAICQSNEAAGDIAFDLEGDYQKALVHYLKAASMAEKMNDLMVMGRLYGTIAALQRFRGLSQEYAGQRREVLEDGIRFADKAAKALEIPYHTTYLSDAHSSWANCLIDIATLVETDPEKKRSLLKRAIDISSTGIAFEKGTWGWEAAGHALSKAIYFLAIIETDIPQRAELLRRALPIRQETVQVTDVLLPHSWNRGAMRNYLALIKSELAGIEPDTPRKRELLHGAVEDMQQCLELCSNWATSPGLIRSLAQYAEWFGDILIQLSHLEARPETARLAVKAYHDAVEFLNRAGQNGPLGVLNWKVAKVHDSLDEFLEAAEAFGRAAEGYRLAAKRILGLNPAFQDLAIYMDAWATIERARLHHIEEEYLLSREHYANAAKTLQTTRGWSYLSKLFLARSLLEEGEALSHDEKHSASTESFRTALKGFEEAKRELEKNLKETLDSQDQHELKSWIGIASQREVYARARIELEEARALDKKGEKAASSRKYRLASDLCKTLARGSDSALERRELETLSRFCEGWAQMKDAEFKVSPELYAKAAQSFLKAKDTATSEKLGLLALGGASICMALQSGTKFRLTRNTELYSETKRQLEAAADYYQEAGFKKTASWTRATQRLFDALVYLTDAETERAPRKKTELYHLAEKHFELAAKLYSDAGFHAKKGEAMEHLQRTREEKATLLAPLEALAEIPTASTAHFASMPLSRGQAFGLERFEVANLVGEIRIPQPDTTVGSDFGLRIDMVNAGKTAATLIKLENVVSKGLEPVPQQGEPQLQGSSIDLKGKRLEYLKTHEIGISLRATRKGTYDLAPRVVFVDEKGNYRSYEFRPLVLTAREPRVSEGLQAPPTVHVPQDFRFEKERSPEVFRHLVKEFLSDYMSKRIVMEKAGWRSLMDLIRDMKIPRSTLYGPGGRTGPVLAELERRGLVETRIFPKERGRGGNIKKVRVAFENAIVKRIVEQSVMENA